MLFHVTCGQLDANKYDASRSLINMFPVDLSSGIFSLGTIRSPCREAYTSLVGKYQRTQRIARIQTLDICFIQAIPSISNHLSTPNGGPQHYDASPIMSRQISNQ